MMENLRCEYKNILTAILRMLENDRANEAENVIRDLCMIFGNLPDNAIRACRGSGGIGESM